MRVALQLDVTRESEAQSKDVSVMRKVRGPGPAPGAAHDAAAHAQVVIRMKQNPVLNFVPEDGDASPSNSAS